MGCFQLYSKVKCELETLKMKDKELAEELSTYKDKVRSSLSVCVCGLLIADHWSLVV